MTNYGTSFDDTTPPFRTDQHLKSMQVQSALLVRKYYEGTIDSILGKSTRGALMSFQADTAHYRRKLDGDLPNPAFP